MKKYFFTRECFTIIFGSVRDAWQLVYCVYKILRMPGPLISIFGSERTTKDSFYAQQAYLCADRCVQQGFSVLTGGGRGVMEAANCGAYDRAQALREKRKRTLGIRVRGLDVGYTSLCAQILEVNSYLVRKLLLVRYTYAYIIFPGGLGTCHELFAVLDLIVTAQMERKPIVLFGVRYWHPITQWYHLASTEYDYIKEAGRNLLYVTDNLDDTMRYIIEHVNQH